MAENNSTHISVVIPVYGCSKSLKELHQRLTSTLDKISKKHEIILVNDASSDDAWSIITEICEKDRKVKGINFSRNFGQHYAITAGLDFAKGDWLVVMDCDLQDRPEEILNLYNKAQEGWDIVFARRAVRNDPLFKRLTSKYYHVVFEYLSGLKTDPAIANFGIYNAKVIAEYNKMKEVARSFNSLINFLGFNICTIDVKHDKRIYGDTTYPFNKRLKLSSDIILSNSNKPLKITVKLGFIISILSFVLAIYNIIAKVFGIIELEGFTTTVFSIWFVGGLLLFVLGILGLYVGMIFNQVKKRQLYIISNIINNENN